MQVTFLGTGGPRPDPTRQGPATLVEAAGLNLLFDAGRGVATQLVRAGVDVVDLDAIFITHHHFDHIGGLGDLLMAVWNNGRTDPLLVVGPPETAAIIDALFSGVYGRDITFRIVEEWTLTRRLEPPTAMVEVREINAGTVELLRGVEVVVGEVEHGAAALELTSDEWVSVGYRIVADGHVVTISGDAVAGRDLPLLAADADVLVMCAYLAEDEITSAYDEFLVGKVLAGVPQAVAIATDAGVGTLVLTHIREKSDEAIETMVARAAASFDGPVIAAHDLDTLDVC
ncbi:MAG: MBL fold metallo-hydrolase [Actinomycetia bacterium]|nr:MBL fold metallo-hydrolase [Actinomycetes bacterium]